MHKTKYRIQSCWFWVRVTLRWLFFFITRQKPSIKHFRSIEIPMKGLPLTLYIKVDNALYFEINGKKYRSRTNVVFLHKDYKTKTVTLKVVGAQKTFEQVLDIEYLQIAQVKSVLKPHEKFELQTNNLTIKKSNMDGLDFHLPSYAIKSRPIKANSILLRNTTINSGSYSDFKALSRQLELETKIPQN